MKIVISSAGYIGINIIHKLYSLRYRPEQLEVWTTDIILSNFCKLHNIKISDQITNTRADLMISVSGLSCLFPNNVLTQFTHGGINLHTGITEQYRGRWNISWGLINGDTTAGYTWHKMNDKFDTGNVLLQQKFTIESEDTALSLNHRLVDHAIYSLPCVWELIKSSGYPLLKVGHYYNQTMPFNGKINDSWDNDKVDRFIKSMYHPPHDPASYRGHKISTFKEYLEIKGKT